MNGILTVMLFTAVVVPNHAIYPGFFPYAPPAVPFPYVPYQRSLPAQPLFAYSVHTALPTGVPASVPPSVPQRAAASDIRSFYSTTDNTYQGYSYQTQYEDGGKSEVVFAVGPEAEQIMKKSLEFIDSIIPKDFGRQFNANETDSTNGSSSAVPRIYPNNAFTLFSPNPFFPNIITSFVNTIVSDNASATQVAEEAQESMIHGDIAASPSPNESINSISNSDETIDSRSSASETSTTIDNIVISDSNSISASTTTTAAENTENSVISATTTASVPTTTISATMMSPTTTASNTISQITTTIASSAISEDESNDITRTTEVTISAESSPDSTTTTATTAAPGSETTTEGLTETTSAQ